MEVSEIGATNIEQPRITKLIIEKDIDQNAWNRDNDEVFKIKGISILRSETNPEGYDFYKLSDLSKTRRLSIVLRDKDGEKEVELPEIMLQRMATYIANKNELVKKEFDCVAFAHAVNGIPYDGPESYNAKNWEKTEYSGNLKPGDTIAIADAKLIGQSFTHFAIYLGDGLFISKFGYKDGPLIVSDFDEMKKGFGGEFVYKMTPVIKK